MAPADDADLESRKASAASIRAKHPDRIPVIVEKRARDSALPDIDKKKFLVPADLTIGQFVYVIRKRIKLAPEQAIFLFVSSGTLPPSVASLQTVRAAHLLWARARTRRGAPSPPPTGRPAAPTQVYDQYKDEDGFIYMKYSGENTFG